MTQQEDIIVDIPQNRVKFFGTTGKMLLPSVSTVAAIIEQIPPTRLLTTNQLSQKLTEQFEVQGTCPVTTRKALQAIAYDASSTVPYWRVVNQNGSLIAAYPGGAASHAVHLQAEGFTIDQGKTLKVRDFIASLAHSG
jgi:alkylated DNA nucleotide flippase Atl1